MKSAFATFEFANSNSRPTPGASKHFLQTEFDQGKIPSNQQISLLQCAQFSRFPDCNRLMFLLSSGTGLRVGSACP